ncbi:7203_t:CDS:1, partial [Racocetra persica]
NFTFATISLNLKRDDRISRTSPTNQKYANSSFLVKKALTCPSGSHLYPD